MQRSHGFSERGCLWLALGLPRGLRIYGSLLPYTDTLTLDSQGRYGLDHARRSRLTFLVYLNDGFTGGATTFYLPSPGGGLEARGVDPQAGAVLCFPQGNTASLVHEGSVVTEGGFKYVIRSDVLYHT